MYLSDVIHNAHHVFVNLGHKLFFAEVVFSWQQLPRLVLLRTNSGGAHTLRGADSHKLALFFHRWAALTLAFGEKFTFSSATNTWAISSFSQFGSIHFNNSCDFVRIDTRPCRWVDLIVAALWPLSWFKVSILRRVVGLGRHTYTRCAALQAPACDRFQALARFTRCWCLSWLFQ